MKFSIAVNMERSDPGQDMQHAARSSWCRSPGKAVSRSPGLPNIIRSS